MSLRKSLDRVFADVEGVYDMRTTDREKIVEFVKGDFKRFKNFREGGQVTSSYYNPMFSPQSQQGTEVVVYPTSSPDSTMAYSGTEERTYFPQAKTSFEQQPISTPSYFENISAPKQEQGFLGYIGGKLSAAQDWITESGLYRGLKSVKNWVNSKPALKRFLDNMREASAKKRQEQPFGSKKDYQRLSLSGMGYNPGTFGSRRTPETVKQLAGAFDPRINPKLVQFMMANRGTSDVLAKVMGTYKDVIKVTKRPRNVIKVDTPTFKLPPR